MTKYMKQTFLIAAGLFLSLAALFPASLQGEELKPILMLKTASPNRLIAVAEKIVEVGNRIAEDDAAMLNELESWRVGIEETRKFLQETQGVIDADCAMGLGLNLNFHSLSPSAPYKVLEPILLLPISDLEQAIANFAQTPGGKDVAPLLQMFLRKIDKNRFLIETPLLSFMTTQEKEYLIIAPIGTALQIQGNPKSLFEDLDKYTIGGRIDFTDVKLESFVKLIGAFSGWAIENFDDQEIPGEAGALLAEHVLGGIIANMDPQQAEQIVNYPMFVLFREIKSISGGIFVDPETFEAEASIVVMPAPGGETEKLILGRKGVKTSFGNFRGSSDNTVFSFNNALSLDEKNTQTLKPHVKTFFDSVLKEFEKEITEEADLAFARNLADSLRKLFESALENGTFDAAFSLDTDGTFLFGATAANTDELIKIGQSLFARFMQTGQNAPGLDVQQALALATLLSKNLKIEETPIEGFKVSSLKIPCAEIAALGGLGADDVPKPLYDATFGVLWAIKNNEAVAFAIGTDFAKAEQSFKKALAGTRNSMPLRQPLGEFSLRSLGVLMQNHVPYVEALRQGLGEDEAVVAVLKQTADHLASADKNAVITLSENFVGSGEEISIRLSAKVIPTIIACTTGLPPAPPAPPVPPRRQPPTDPPPPVEKNENFYLVVAADGDNPVARNNGAAIAALFKGWVDRKVLNVVTIPAEQLKEIPETLEKLSVQNRDTVCLFVSASGGIDKNGQYFTLHGSKLYRSQLRAALENVKCRLKILVSDSAPQNAGTVTANTFQADAAATTSELFDSLFFKATGIVDIASPLREKVPAFTEAGIGRFTAELAALSSAHKNEKTTWERFSSLFDASEEFPPVLLTSGNTDFNKESFASVYPNGCRFIPTEDPEITPVQTNVPKEEKIRFGVQAADNKGDGVLVTRIFQGHAGHKAGLKVGHVIVSIDGKKITSEQEYSDAVDAAGKVMMVTVRHADGRVVTIGVTLSR